MNKRLVVVWTSRSDEQEAAWWHDDGLGEESRLD